MACVSFNVPIQAGAYRLIRRQNKAFTQDQECPCGATKVGNLKREGLLLGNQGGELRNADRSTLDYGVSMQVRNEPFEKRPVSSCALTVYDSAITDAAD